MTIGLFILLLAGCQQSDQKKPAQTLIQSGKDQTNSLKKDSVEAFDEQMLRWHVLHGGGEQMGDFVLNFVEIEDSTSVNISYFLSEGQSHI